MRFGDVCRPFYFRSGVLGFQLGLWLDLRLEVGSRIRIHDSKCWVEGNLPTRPDWTETLLLEACPNCVANSVNFFNNPPPPIGPSALIVPARVFS